MAEPAEDLLQRSVERLGAFTRAIFGIGLTLSPPGDEAPRTPGSEGLQVLARPVRGARTGRRLLVTQGFMEDEGTRRSSPGKPGEVSRLAPGQVRTLGDFLDMAAGLLGVLADNQDAAAFEPLREQLWRDLLGAPTIVGVSPATRALREALPAAANSREPLFIAGEAGSGRGSLAAAVHRAGPRAAGPFIVENLGAIPKALRETELFGSGGTTGLLTSAAGGTLYLAGIEHLSARCQERLLGFLTGSTGGSESGLPARIIASADIDPREAAARGRFNRDLADRLTAFTLAIPPLRERPEDIPLIAAHLVNRRAAALGAAAPALPPETLDALRTQRWTGNVRELDEELTRASCGRAMLQPEDFTALVSQAERSPVAAAGSSLRQAVGELEVGLISQTLAGTNWNKSRAARALGLSRLGLQKKIDRYGIDRRR
jgi:DNA-binding NtrC family response regulator